jgi:hypothetical protein
MKTGTERKDRPLPSERFVEIVLRLAFAIANCTGVERHVQRTFLD